MECRELRERISAFVDGEALPSEVRLIEDHLDQCAECRAVERKMRTVGIGVSRIEGDLPPDFREKLFARLEAEELLPRRRSLFVFSLRWAAVPVAAAAALALFLLVSSETGKDAVPPQGQAPVVAQRAPEIEPRESASPTVSPGPGPQTAVAPRKQTPPAQTAKEELTPEEREIVAYLDILEDPSVLDAPDDVDQPSGRSGG